MKPSSSASARRSPAASCGRIRPTTGSRSCWCARRPNAAIRPSSTTTSRATWPSAPTTCCGSRERICGPRTVRSWSTSQVRDGVAAMPAAGPPRDAILPAPAERVLDNGLRVVAFSQRNLPLVAAQLVVRCGGAAEHEDEAGLAALVAALLTQGTTARGATELAATVDALGAQLNAASGYDASVVSVSATTPAFPVAFALLDEVVRRPAFAPAGGERVRAKSISDLALTYANPSALVRLGAQRGAHRGGGPPGPAAG